MKFHKLTFILLGLALLFSTGDSQGGNPDSHKMPYQSPPPREIDILHQKIRVQFFSKKPRVRGEVELTFTPLARRISHFSLDQIDLDIQSVHLGTRALKFRTTSRKLIIGGAPAFHFGKKYTIRIRYRAQPRRGLYFLDPHPAYPHRPVQIWSHGSERENRFWYPSHDYPNEFMSTEMFLTVEKPLVAIGPGKLIKKEEKGSWTTYHWREDSLHPNYLVSIGVGKFKSHRLKGGKTPIVNYAPEALAERLPLVFGDLPQMMSYYREKLGLKYPFSQCSNYYVHDYDWGVMQVATGTRFGPWEFYDQRAFLDFPTRDFVCRNLSIAWFASSVVPRDWSQMWLIEGLGAYAGLLYIEDKMGSEWSLEMRRRLLDAYLEEKVHSPIVRYRYRDTSQLWDVLTVDKGALVCHLLRRKFGPKIFWRALSHYLKKHRGTNVETSHLRQAFEAVTGKPLKRFFRQWIHRAGHPLLKCSWQVDKKREKLYITVEQKQKKVFPCHLEVAIRTGSKTEGLSIFLNKPSTTLVRPLPKGLQGVEFDPHLNLLGEIKTTKSEAEWITQLVSGTSLWSRIKAARALKSFVHSHMAHRALVRQAKEKSWTLKREIARSLAYFGTFPQTISILQGFLQDKTARVRRAALKSLGKMKAKSAWKTLVKHLEKDPSYWCQIAAAHSLANIDRRRARPLLIKALQLDSHNRVLSRAILEKLGDFSPHQAILRAAKKRTALGFPQLVRRAAFDTLFKEVKEKPQEKKKLVKRLIKILNSNQVGSGWSFFPLRMKVIDLLGKSESPKAYKALSKYRTTPHLLFEVREKIDESLQILSQKK